MTSISQDSNPPVQAKPTGSQAAAQKPGPTSTTAPAVGRSSYAAATKQSILSNASGSSKMATAIEGSMPSQHGNADAIPTVNGSIQPKAAVPLLEPSVNPNGNNPLPPTNVPDHTRNPSFTFTSSGINGGPPGGRPSKGNHIQFGSAKVGGSPASRASPGPANVSPANLGVAGLVNPRTISPQTSPSPIPQPVISGGRPPSSLQSQANGLVFGQSGPEPIDLDVSVLFSCVFFFVFGPLPPPLRFS
jgi:translation initiation factor 4G